MTASPPSNALPRYLPHMQYPKILQMGLSPLEEGRWIETDADLPRYHRHKLEQRALHGDGVYRVREDSLAMQRELAHDLYGELASRQRQWFAGNDDGIRYLPDDLAMQPAWEEPLWQCSLWVADDLVLMAPIDGEYRLVAASLCSPSHWRLADKFDRSIADIHAPIPGFDKQLTPAVNRFFGHLKARHPVVRYNWSLQADDSLHPDPDRHQEADADTPLYYRTERQSLRRLWRTGAVVFTIRVYLHPLETLAQTPGAMESLFAAIDATEPALADYKDFTDLAPALARYRPK